SSAKRAGIKKGDRVTISLPMVPELPIAMLACARIGAPHSVIFGGFAPDAVRERIHDAESTVLITADGGFRRGGIVPLKKNVDEALKEGPDVRTVIVLRRTGQAIDMVRGGAAWSRGAMSGGRISSMGLARTARPRRWTPRTCSFCSTRPARPASPRASSTPPAAT